MELERGWVGWFVRWEGLYYIYHKNLTNATTELFSARPANCTLTPLRADASAMACSRSAAGPLPTRAEKSESGRASSSAG